MLAQHVRLVHPEHDEEGRVENEDDLCDQPVYEDDNDGDHKGDSGNDLGDTRGSASPSTSGTESADRYSGEDDDLAAKERELANKEAELRDYERVVEQSEEEAKKAREELLKGLRAKYEYLCQKVGPEEAQRLFQKVTKECQNESVNKAQ